MSDDRQTASVLRNSLGAIASGLCLIVFGFPAIAADLGRFDPSRDLFLPQFDCKTDVDDLHSVAAVATMLRDARFEGVDYHAVAGAYGMQDGPYVPAPFLFDLAFGQNWSDAHGKRDEAVASVAEKVAQTLRAGGSVWVAEGGQSDFTADLLAAVEEALPDVDLRERVHVVQHSDWNEEVTTPQKLALVKQVASYHKIPDGNATGNGTPGFKSGVSKLWRRPIDDPRTGEVWRAARRVGEQFNGRDGRYNNTAVESGGIDFSDTAETCWIFGFDHLRDAEQFFEEFASPAAP